MKNTYLVRGICTIAVLAALLTGCSSGGSDTDYVSELAGTWVATTSRVSSSSTYTTTSTLTINADGTFSRIEVEYDSYWDDYTSDAYTGTVSADEDSITLATKKEYSSYTNMTTVPTTGGTTSTETETIPYLLKDKTIYVNVLTRKGSGSGIIGTWLAESSTSEAVFGYTYITDSKTTVTIAASTITAVTVDNHYYKETPTTSYPTTDTDSYTYTVVDAKTLKVTESGYSSSTNWTYEISDDQLILTNGLNAYVKQ